MKHAQYDQKKIDALASELMEPQRLAGGGAIRRAAEAVRQAADSDLDMSTEARMAMAADQGFNTNLPLYHVTNASFDAFKIPENKFLKYGKGVYTSPNPNYVDRYIRKNRDIESGYNEGANVMPLYARGNIANEKDWEAARQQMMSEGVAPAGYNRQQEEIQRRLKEKGFDGLNMFGNEIIIFDPSNIRSVNAAFDPAKRESSNILSGLGAAAIGAGALTSEEEPEGMSKGGLADKLRSAASSVKEAGNVYKAAVGNMFSPFEPVEPQLGDPNDYEFPELRLRRPGIVNLAVGMPNMFADMRNLFGAVKDVAIGDEVPDEEWARWDKATEAQGRYEEDMDKFLRSYTGKSMDELSGPMSAVLGVSEAAAQPGIISAKVVAGLPSLARYLSHLAEFATPVTVASPGAMLTGATVNAGIRALPALTDDDELKQIYNSYLDQDLPNKTGRDLTGREQARLDKYLQELLGKKDGGLIDRINQSFYENISKPAVGTAIDMTLGLGDLAQMAARYLGNKAGFDAGEFTSVAQPVKEAIGVDDYNPYTIGGVGASILPFAAAGRTAQAINAAPAGVRQIQAALPNLGRESAAYVGAEAAGAGAREFMPDSPMAELFANVAGGMGGSALGSQPTSMGIIKERGGNWLAGSIEDELERLHTAKVKGVYTPAQLLEQMYEIYPPETLASLDPERLRTVTSSIERLKANSQIDNWIDTKLNKYIRNEMATESDPIRLQADAFEGVKAERLAQKDEQIARAIDNMERTRLERGRTPEEMTASQARIRELQRERALIAAQTGLHVDPNEVGIDRYTAPRLRLRHGYDEKGIGQSDAGKAWEDSSDVTINIDRAGDLLTESESEWVTPEALKRMHDDFVAKNPWLSKIPPESTIYSMGGRSNPLGSLGFDHMMDELRNATRPDSDLPDSLRIDPNYLSKMSVPQIVQRVDEINAFRDVQRIEADALKAFNAATIPHRDYETIPYTNEPNVEGLRWVQIASPDKTEAVTESVRKEYPDLERNDPYRFNRIVREELYSSRNTDTALQDALKYEGDAMGHCVGGYCDEVRDGATRIFSLRDANGRPHATVEVQDVVQGISGEILNEMEPGIWDQIVAENGYHDSYEWLRQNRPDLLARLEARPTQKIEQIKGIRNAAPASKYEPFVQDFVKSGQWSEVGDLRNTGLFEVTPGQRLPGFSKEIEPGYYTLDEFKQMAIENEMPEEIMESWFSKLQDKRRYGYKSGGSVTAGGLVYDADAINALAAQLMEPQGYAGGGAIRKAAEAIGGARTLPPLENAQKTQLGSSTIPSYAKAREILSSKKRILDFGAGRGQGASLIGADTFEPYPREGFSPSYNSVTDIPSGSYDGLTSLNVLNVMPREVRDDAVRNIGRVLMDGGEAVITTRGRDVMTANGVDGPEPMSRITTADTYQKGFTQQELIDYVSNVLGEGYVVSSLPQKVGAAGVLVKKVGRNAESASDASLERLAEGGPPPRSRIARAAAAIRGAATPPREIPDEQRVSDEEMMRIARDLGVDVDETDVLTDMPSITQYTAADRAAAGRRAASLISTQHPIKASEALGRLMEQGFRRTATTQADRTIVGDGNIGGPNFPVLGMVDPEYAGRSWGVMTQGPATTLIRQSSPETAWTTMLGSADQLKSNQLVFDDLQDAFVSSMRQGNLTPELESKYNQNLRLLFGEDADIRDPEIWSRANTFAKRSAFADILMGKGLGGEKSGRGVIFNPSEILKRQTEPSLLHPTQGGTVPTYALGPRMFTIEDSADYRPDLHPGFPMLLKGRDLGLNVIPTPTEIYLPDWHRNFREVMAQKTPPRKAPAGRYDLASGLKGQGLPSQDLTDDYIRHLIREGFSQGGLANYRDMIRSN